MTDAPWLAIAATYLGTQEVVGAGSNPRIVAMAKRLGGWVKSFFTDDDIPWCGVFVGSCLVEAGFPASRQTLAARSYETYGVPLNVPAPGAILVFSRAGGGHVGFYVGESTTAYRVLGGNQGNAVSETWIAKTRLTAIRWPTEDRPTQGPVLLTSAGQPVSTNEA